MSYIWHLKISGIFISIGILYLLIFEREEFIDIIKSIFKRGDNQC